jgi:predicted GNAT family acetyltransferase
MAENVTDNPGKSRYEVHEDGALAGFVQYERGGDTIILSHTETEPRFRGEGLAGRLVQACLDDVRKQGLNVVPLCPYVRDWMGVHPGYADLVPAEDRADFGL